MSNNPEERLLRPGDCPGLIPSSLLLRSGELRWDSLSRFCFFLSFSISWLFGLFPIDGCLGMDDVDRWVLGN